MQPLAIVAKNAIQSIQHHSPAVLTGFAIAGVASTALLTARGALAADKVVRQVKEDGQSADAFLSGPEMFKLVWTCYIPPAVTGIGRAHV